MRLAFVPPRFGPGVLGGAEAVAREMAIGLAARGHDVEILTTCALDHYTWDNELPEGEAREEGLTVRRFATRRPYTRAGLRAQLSIGSGTVPDLDHQVSWLSFQFTVPGMFEYLLTQNDRYDAIIFLPYLFWPATVCLPFVADKAVVVPCLHDEPYARLEMVRPVFASPALAWFLSGPEHSLAHQLGPVTPRHSVMGAGVPVPNHLDPDGFRARRGRERPFLVYAGRREAGKGTAWLLDVFARALEAGADVDLVLLGKGDISADLARAEPGVAARVVDLGYVSDQERNDAFAAALAYVQPSTLESFSRTVMEAWLAGAPVLANSAGSVVAWHCQRSGGGATFGDGAELARLVKLLGEHPGAAAAMAEQGERYVLDNYSWDVVLDRAEASLRAAFPATGRAPGPGPLPTKDKQRWCLVVGSYPPVPGAASATTLAMVKSLWAQGVKVTVASPRASAAHEVVQNVGSGAADRVAQLGREHNCREVVVCLERGWPFLAWERQPRLGPWAPDLRTRAVRAWAACLGSFDRATLVVTGEVGLTPSLFGLLWPAVSRVLTTSQASAERLAALGAPGVGVIEPADLPELYGPLVLGPLEPGYTAPWARGRRLLGASARRVLGRHEPVVRAATMRTAAELRRRARRLSQGSG